jgi:hypothetical protein
VTVLVSPLYAVVNHSFGRYTPATSPLYETIETDALDALFSKPVPGADPPFAVEFVTLEYRVVVVGCG